VGPRLPAAPAGAAGPHRAAAPRAAVRAPARTGVQTLARIDVHAAARTGVRVPARTGVRVPARTGVRVPARTGARARPGAAAPVPPRTGAQMLHRTGVRAAPRTGVPRIAEPAAQAPVRPSAAGATGPPGTPTRTAGPAGRPGLVRATGRDDPQQAATRVAAPGPGAARAGPRIVTAHVGAVQPVPVTVEPRRTAGPVVPAGLVRRVPPAAGTGVRVLRERARTPRAGTTRTRALPGRVVSALVPAARPIGQSATAAMPPGGRHVTGRQDPRATEAATGPRGRPAPATATAPATVTALPAVSGPAAVTGSASIAGAAAESAQAADVPGASTVPGTVSAPGPGGTMRQSGRRARPGRSFRTQLLPSSSIPRRGPS
jgi:hypothetical protein